MAKSLCALVVYFRLWSMNIQGFLDPLHDSCLLVILCTAPELCLMITGSRCKKDRQRCAFFTGRRQFPWGCIEHVATEASKHCAIDRILCWTWAKASRLWVHWKWNAKWYVALLWWIEQKAYMEHPRKDSTRHCSSTWVSCLNRTELCIPRLWQTMHVMSYQVFF